MLLILDFALTLNLNALNHNANMMNHYVFLGIRFYFWWLYIHWQRTDNITFWHSHTHTRAHTHRHAHTHALSHTRNTGSCQVEIHAHFIEHLYKILFIVASACLFCRQFKGLITKARRSVVEWITWALKQSLKKIRRLFLFRLKVLSSIKPVTHIQSRVWNNNNNKFSLSVAHLQKQKKNGLTHYMTKCYHAFLNSTCMSPHAHAHTDTHTHTHTHTHLTRTVKHA